LGVCHSIGGAIDCGHWLAETEALLASSRFHTTDSFDEGLLRAINLGGDSDTIGAIYGQVCPCLL
jgi:ADP-ribosylglycohydrolase